MRDLIAQAEARLMAVYHEGVGNCRRGHPDRLFSPPTPGSVSQRFEDAYETWMRLRAQAGDRFALSLGYGRTEVA
jgi:hypothetical protein